MSQKIRAVIFDMDGLLVDSEPLINAAAIAMFKEKGLVVQPEDFLPFVGAGEDRYIGGVAEKYQFHLDVPQAKKRTYEIYLELVPTRLEAFPGVHALVQTCRQAGLRVAVASGTDRVKALAGLRKIGLPEESWNTVVSGEQVQRNKPAPDIFLSTAQKLGVDPSACVVLEDLSMASGRRKRPGCAASPWPRPFLPAACRRQMWYATVSRTYNWPI